MILDGYLIFDSAAALTSTAASTNIFDLQNARDMGVGDDPALKLFCTVTTAFQSTGSSTLDVALQGSTDGSTWDTYLSLPQIAKSALVAGFRFGNVDWPRVAPGKSRPRYLRLYYTVGTADFTAGALSAMLVLDRQDQISYPPGIGISN